MKRGLEIAREHGLTTVHDMGLEKDSYEALKTLGAQKQIPIHFVGYVYGGDKDDVEHWLSTGPSINQYQNFLTVNSLLLKQLVMINI